MGKLTVSISDELEKKLRSYIAKKVCRREALRKVKRSRRAGIEGMVRAECKFNGGR